MVSDRLRELIGSGEFDWDNPAHRVAYLKAWVKGEVKPYPAPDPEGTRPGTGSAPRPS